MYAEQTVEGQLTKEQLEKVVQNIVKDLPKVAKVLVVHPDYSRHDYAEILVPLIYRALEQRGLKRLDTLNAAGTHRQMNNEEVEKKLGLNRKDFPLVGTMHNHLFDDPRELVHVVDIPADYVATKTAGHLHKPLSVSINKLFTDDYDAIICVNGTVPHEATGFSGGTKILFPGCSGPEVIGLFHWAAVLIGIPTIIGTVANPAREVVNEGAKYIFKLTGERCPLVSFDMVYAEDAHHNVLAKGLFAGVGPEGFQAALESAAALSATVHINYLDEPKDVVVQALPAMYDEVWTAGKGSYKLQRPGVISSGGEVILYAPHIHCFHSNKRMDDDIRTIGYHGRDWVVKYCDQNPGFDKNIASHSINVRGLGKLVGGREEFPFKVTLATQVSEADCKAVGLGYRDPKTLRPEDFQGPGKLWIHEGGQWLYSRR